MNSDKLTDIDTLLQKLRSDNDKIRIEAKNYLKKNIKYYEEFIPLFLEMFNDKYKTRRELVFIIKAAAKEFEYILDLVINEVKKENEAIRWTAAFTIGQMGTRAQKAFPTILDLAERETREPVLSKLIWALGKIGIQDPRVKKLFLESLQAKNQHLRSKTIQAIGRLYGSELQDKLIDSLVNDNAITVRRIAGYQLSVNVKNKTSIMANLQKLYEKNTELKVKLDLAYTIALIEDNFGYGFQQLEYLMENHQLTKSDVNMIERLRIKKEKKKGRTEQLVNI